MVLTSVVPKVVSNWLDRLGLSQQDDLTRFQLHFEGAVEALPFKVGQQVLY